MAEQRKLATIMAVDVAGYSRAAEEDDSAAAASIGKLRTGIERIVATYGGRIFSSAGDGFMVEFPAASSSIQAASDLLNESAHPKLRIGLHLGEVIVSANGDLLGHGVNVAARLQSLAEPGTAVVSKAVQAQVRGSLQDAMVARGKVQLEKMNERLDVFTLGPEQRGISRIGWRRARSSLIAVVLIALLAVAGYFAFRALAPPAGPPTLAVLKFEPAGASRTDVAFADRFSIQLYDMLSGGGPQVISQALSFEISEDDPRAVRRELGAEYVLDGSIERFGDRIIIAAELSNARTGVQVWRDNFEGDDSLVLWMQQQINARVRAALLVLSEAANRGRDVDPAALRLFMYAWAPNPEGEDIFASHAGAMDSYQRAVRIQPDFVQAWSDLARVGAIMQYRAPTVEERIAAGRIGKEAAERAAALAPDRAYSYIARAMFMDPIAERERYQRELERAARRDDAQVITFTAQAYELQRFGRSRDALAMVSRARELDAYSIYILSFPDPLEQMDTPARYEDSIRALGASAADPPASWRTIHMGWLALGNYPRATEALSAFAQLPAQIARNDVQLSAPFAAKAARWLEEDRALHQALTTGRGRTELAASLAHRADLTASGFRHDRTAEEFYNYLLPALAMVSGVDAAYAAWEHRLALLPAPDGYWRATEPLEHETYFFTEAMYRPAMTQLRADPRFWRMIARMEFPAWWLNDERWPPDFCRDVPYECAAAARDAFAARQRS